MNSSVPNKAMASRRVRQLVDGERQVHILCGDVLEIAAMRSSSNELCDRHLLPSLHHPHFLATVPCLGGHIHN